MSGERPRPGPAGATSLPQARLTSSKLLDSDPLWEAWSPPVLASLYAFALPSNPATAQDLLKIEWTSQHHAPATAVSRDGFWPPLRIRVKLGRACIWHSWDTDLDSLGPETASGLVFQRTLMKNCDIFLPQNYFVLYIHFSSEITALSVCTFWSEEPRPWPLPGKSTFNTWIYIFTICPIQ